jgi:hypothetical protein
LTFTYTNNKKTRWELSIMTIYRARACPRCQYYVGYWLPKPIRGLPEVSVKSFCLNCNYQFPVRAVVCGRKNLPPRRRKRPRSRLPGKPSGLQRSVQSEPTAPSASKTLAHRAKYPRELRAIGQELEKRRFTRFNLKCSSDIYFVWSTEDGQIAGQAGSATRSEHDSPDDPDSKMFLDRIAGVLFNAGDIERLERQGVENRRQRSAATNGRRLSHLLRTVGEQVYRRNQRLLAIAWQDRHVSVVAESATGRREINVLRTDNLYDLWVRMYLQRSH